MSVLQTELSDGSLSTCTKRAQLGVVSYQRMTQGSRTGSLTPDPSASTIRDLRKAIPLTSQTSNIRGIQVLQCTFKLNILATN